MRSGLFLPPFDALADPVLLARLSAEAEEAGWDGIFLWDHLLYSPPVERILDPWICLAAMAASTERILLGQMVTPLARRRPQVVARQAVTLDLLSRGRLILGFGLGDDGAGELSAFGEQTGPRERARMLDEGLEVLTGLLSGQPVDHRGDHYTAQGIAFQPEPYDRAGIPIWLGARWPNRAPVRRAAGYGGLFIIQMALEHMGELRTRLAGAGADLDHFEIVVRGGFPDEAAAWSDAGATWWLSQLGPFDLDLSEVHRVINAGPPNTAS